ncbi:flavodoxin domain-containing protein [Devriesea agamarum]|uniref:flavodoxin domain-containing protein n=1 Tax=Devriesea agamarum TaxID=472569 RepID=UPI00071C2CFC|nr:flavodoxin domain-containing protein [Devriesea agamarum]
MSIVIVYASHTGATQTLAERLAVVLAEMGYAAEAIDVERDPDPATYDAVVLGSGIRIGKIEKSASTWVSAHRDTLATRPLALFTCSGGAVDPDNDDPAKILAKTASKLPSAPVATAAFAGWMLADKLTLAERAVLKAVGSPMGDFRDLDAVESWGKTLPALLGV